MLSELWVGSTYEFVRLPCDRKLIDDTGEVAAIAHDLRLLRVAISKNTKSPAIKTQRPSCNCRNDPRKAIQAIYTFMIGAIGRRAHIMPRGICSTSGSMVWQVIDLNDGRERLIERRGLADRVLKMWGEETPAAVARTKEQGTGRTRPLEAMPANWSDEETNEPLLADHQNFYKVEKWIKDGTKIERMLFAGSNLDKARALFESEIRRRPRIRLTIRQRTRVLQQWPEGIEGAPKHSDQTTRLVVDFPQLSATSSKSTGLSRTQRRTQACVADGRVTSGQQGKFQRPQAASR